MSLFGGYIDYKAFVPLRLVPFRLVPFRLVPFRLVPLRLVPLRLVPLRLDPLRICKRINFKKNFQINFKNYFSLRFVLVEGRVCSRLTGVADGMLLKRDKALLDKSDTRLSVSSLLGPLTCYEYQPNRSYQPECTTRRFG